MSNIWSCNLNLTRDQSPVIYTQWETRVLELGGTKWESGNDIPQSNLVFCTCDHIHNFIRMIEQNGLEYKYTVVSAASDYGLEYQEPSYKDMARWIPMIDYSTLGQRDLYIPARLDQENCLAADKFTTKMYSWKKATFDLIPFKKWYCTNANVNETNVVQIPFGLDQESYDLIQKYKDLTKEEKIFACFSSNTNERHSLKKYIKNFDCFDFHESLDKEQFIYRLCKNKYTICPAGNGLDTFRCSEALYANSIPILLEKDISWSPYGDLTGFLSLDTMRIKYNQPENFHIMCAEYWKNLISSCLY